MPGLGLGLGIGRANRRGAPSWTPAKLPGLVMAVGGTASFRAGNIYLDLGTTLVTSLTQPIRRLQSHGSAFNWDAPNDAARPLLGGANGAGTKYWAEFDGSNDALTTSSAGFPSGTVARSFSFAFSVGTIGAGQGIFSYGTQDFNSGIYIFINASGTLNIGQYGHNILGVTNPLTALEVGVPYTLIVNITAAGLWTATLNGEAYGDPTTMTTNTILGSDLAYLGSDVFNQFSALRLYGAIVATGELSEADVLNVIDYLSSVSLASQPIAISFPADQDGAVYSGPYTEIAYGGRTIRPVSQLDVIVRGTEFKIEFLNLGAAMSVTIDGGAPSTVTLANDNSFTYTTIFTGLSDTWHTVKIRSAQYFAVGLPNRTFQVAGASPAMDYAPTYGPTYLAVNPWPPFPADGSGPYGADFGGVPAWHTQCLRFKATCDSISVWTYQGAGATRLVIDGVPQAGTFRNGGGTFYEWITVATGLDDDAEHEYAVYAYGVFFGEMMVSNGSVNQTTLAARKSIVFYGDSITYGQGTTTVLDAYAPNAAIAMGMGFVNLGVPSSQVHDDGNPGLHPRPGSSTDGIASVVANSSVSDTVVILYGTNDACPGSYSYATFQADYETMLAGIVAGMETGTKIYCLGILDTTASVADQTVRTAKNAAIAAAVTAVGGADSHYVSTDGWIVVATDTVDGLHPNDAGAVKIANRLVLNGFGAPTISIASIAYSELIATLSLSYGGGPLRGTGDVHINWGVGAGYQIYNSLDGPDYEYEYDEIGTYAVSVYTTNAAGNSNTATDDVAFPPVGTPGQTLMWRADMAYSGSINAGAPSNFTSVGGEGYARQVGPRFGPADDPSWSLSGWSVRVPTLANAPGTPDLIWNGQYNNYDDTWQRGMACCMVNLAGCSLDNTRLFGGYGYQISPGVGDLGSCMLGVKVKLTTSGAPGLTLTYEDGLGGPATTAIDAVHLDEWFFVSYVWEQIGGTQTTLRAYYGRRTDANPILLGQYAIGSNAAKFPCIIRSRAYYNEPGIGAIVPWNGAVGAMSWYACDTLANAAKFPADIVWPPLNRIVRPWTWSETGSDSNDGYGTNSAWLTGAKIEVERKRGTFLGNYPSWAESDGTDASLSTIADFSDQLDWETAYDNGDITPQGSALRVLGTVQTDVQLDFTVIPGVDIYGTGTINVRRSMGSTFTQPNAGTYPNVWQLLGNFPTYCTVNEDGKPSTPLVGANLAAVIATINTTPGRCFADGSGIYFSTWGGTNPNTDGLTRTTGRSLVSNGVAPGVIGIADGRVRGVTVNGGGSLIDYASGNSIAQYCVAIGNQASIVVVDGVTVKYGSKHAIGAVQNGTTGFGYRKNVIYGESEIISDWSTDVSYTGAATAGQIFSSWKGCSEAGTILVAGSNVGSDTAPHISILFHSVGGHSGDAFSTRITNCDFTGQFDESLHRPGELVISGGTLSYTNMISAGTTIDSCTMLTPRMGFGPSASTTWTDCEFGSGLDVAPTGWGSAPSMQGTQVFTGGSFDLSTFPFSTSGNAVWTNGGTIDLTMTGVTFIGTGTSGVGMPLISGASNADDILLTGCRFNGTSQKLLVSYNDGATTADRTVKEAIELGIVVGTLSPVVSLDVSTVGLVATVTIANDGGSISSLDWSASTGSPVITGAGLSWTFTYPLAGTWAVALTATNAEGYDTATEYSVSGFPSSAVSAAIASPTYCASDASHLVPCGDGDSIRWWKDAITGTWNEQATGASQPVLRSLGGGQWAAEFVVSKQITLALPSWPESTGLMSTRIRLTNLSSDLFAAINGDPDYLRYNGDSKIYAKNFRTSRADAIANYPADLLWHSITHASGADYRVYVDSSLAGTVAYNAGPTPTTLTIGHNSDGGYMIGAMVTGILLAKANSERAEFEAYLDTLA